MPKTQLIYPTTKKIDGPWLIERKALEELDFIVGKYWEKLEVFREELNQQCSQEYREKLIASLSPEEKKANKRVIEKETQEYLKNSSFSENQSEKSIKIDFKNEKSYICDSFESAFRERLILDDLPIGFFIHLSVPVDKSAPEHKLECDIYLDDEGLKFNVQPKDLQKSQDLFIRIDEWAKIYKPKLWEVWWYKTTDILKKYWVYIILLIVIMTGFYGFQNAQHYQFDRFNKIQAILREGVSEENIYNAIELLLWFQVKPVVDFGFPANLVNPKLFIVTMISLLYLFLLFIIPWPSSILGIGLGIDRINFWKQLKGVLLWSLPVFLIVYFILPALSQLFNKLVGI